MNIGENNVGIIFKRIEHAIAEMHVDVHIPNAPDAVTASQRLDDDTEIIEYAKSSCMAPPRMMQSANWLEAASTYAIHYQVKAVQSGTNHMRRDLEYARKHRRVAEIEVVKAD